MVYNTNLCVQLHISYSTDPIRYIECELVYAELLFKEVSQIMLEEIATSPLLHKLGKFEPRHNRRVLLYSNKEYTYTVL